MINIGVLYSKSVILKHIKLYLKNNTNIKWKNVYSINFFSDDTAKPPKLVVGDNNFMNIHEVELQKVFVEGWDRRYKWWRFW